MQIGAPSRGVLHPGSPTQSDEARSDYAEHLLGTSLRENAQARRLEREEQEAKAG